MKAQYISVNIIATCIQNCIVNFGFSFAKVKIETAASEGENLLAIYNSIYLFQFTPLANESASV